MACREGLSRRACSPEDEPDRLWWSPDFSCGATSRWTCVVLPESLYWMVGHVHVPIGGIVMTFQDISSLKVSAVQFTKWKHLWMKDKSLIMANGEYLYLIDVHLLHEEKHEFVLGYVCFSSFLWQQQYLFSTTWHAFLMLSFTQRLCQPAKAE